MSDRKRYQPLVSRHALVLAGFALFVTTILAVTNHSTSNRIAKNEKQQREKIFLEILPAYNYDYPPDQFKLEIVDDNTQMTRHCYIAAVNGTPVATVITATATDGYAGEIELLVGIMADGTVSGVRVSKHNETPGLGDAIELHRSQWIKAFDGKSLASPEESGWALRKDNGVFDQFTGATITPRAVVKEVKNTLLFFRQHKAQILQDVNENKIQK